jgi:hypothetical protein
VYPRVLAKQKYFRMGGISQPTMGTAKYFRAEVLEPTGLYFVPMTVKATAKQLYFVPLCT